MNNELETKIAELKAKVAAQTEDLQNDIYSICELMKYQDSSRFSYNIDKLKEFNSYLQDFELLNK